MLLHSAGEADLSRVVGAAGHSEGFSLVCGSRSENFHIQMNLSEFDSGHKSPATRAGLWETVGGYMREKEKMAEDKQIKQLR